MNIIWVIREICAKDSFESLFDFHKSYSKIIDLSNNKKDATCFTAMIYGKARATLIELIHDAYRYETYIKKIKSDLIAGGQYEDEATRAIEIFLEAFGFPGFRKMDDDKVDTIITENGDFRTEYTGEVRDGKEHGVGIKTLYYQGNWCNYYETVWVDGTMCGYEYAKEMEFGIYEDKKIGFVVNNSLIGKARVFASSGEEFNDLGKELNIE